MNTTHDNSKDSTVMQPSSTQAKPKKKYTKPSMEIIQCSPSAPILSHSGNHGNHGHACEHGGGKWFCDDDE